MTTLFKRASVTVLVATGAAAIALDLTIMAPTVSNAAALIGQCQSRTTATAQPPRGNGSASAGASASVSPSRRTTEPPPEARRRERQPTRKAARR